jgi:hypothetical protein
MRNLILLISILISTAATLSAEIIYVDDLADGKAGSGSQADPHRRLQAAIDRAGHLDTLIIRPGRFEATPYAYTEALCGNCENHRTEVKASRGFLIEGKGLIIIGAGPDSTILVTNAGYGVLFVNSRDSEIRNLQITGGVRDYDGAATDAAIVARQASLTVQNCLISGNTNRPDSIVVGIGGIMGREGAELTIVNNRINNNSWDGVALYRGATAYIADNEINGGRGAGVGITWDATATVVRNRVTNYWKGIGSFGDTRVVCANNIVINNLGWGIIATGSSYMDATNNVVYHNGNCGMAIWGDDCTGRFANNIVVDNGWRDEWVCPCVGIWNLGKLFNFDISHNDVWNNEAGQYRDMPDYTERDGNLSIDPKFTDIDSFRLAPGSPLIDKGSPLLSDPDGTASDIGVFGGPRARQK